jgi:FtsH-binding integral membrane protein
VEYAAERPVVAAATNVQDFLRKVFGWMFAGLAITAAAAAAIGSSDELLTTITENPLIFIGLVVIQLGLVIAISAAIDRISSTVALALFFLYAASVGVIFALVFELYTAQSIFTTFLVTAGMFGAMAAWGYFTDRDLSAMGSILFMALVGLILATIVNIFWANEILYWVTTYAGVLIFAGLTAYDMQKVKRYGESGAGGEAAEKAAVQGALALYLDFINLFLFLLRIFGRAR